MSVLIALAAAGAVLVSMILSVSLPRLCTLLATSATKALNLLKLAMRSSFGSWVELLRERIVVRGSDRRRRRRHGRNRRDRHGHRDRLDVGHAALRVAHHALGR